MENRKIWYAVLKDADDNDWGTGSEDRAAALEMAEETGPEAYVAVIDITDDDPLCIDEIRRDEDGDWVSSAGAERYQF